MFLVEFKRSSEYYTILIWQYHFCCCVYYRKIYIINCVMFCLCNARAQQYNASAVVFTENDSRHIETIIVENARAVFFSAGGRRFIDIFRQKTKQEVEYYIDLKKKTKQKTPPPVDIVFFRSSAVTAGRSATVRENSLQEIVKYIRFITQLFLLIISYFVHIFYRLPQKRTEINPRVVWERRSRRWRGPSARRVRSCTR